MITLLPLPSRNDNRTWMNIVRLQPSAKASNLLLLVLLRDFFFFFFFKIKSASCGAKIPSIISWFQVLVFGIIKQSTVASTIESRIGEFIFGGCLIGSHLCCQIMIDLLSPTRQHAPSRITSRRLRMLFQAYEPVVDSLASKIEQCGKNLALKTLWRSESVLERSRQDCLASRASLNMTKFLKPIPLITLDFVNSSHRIQCIFLRFPHCPYQNFFTMTSIS